MRTKGEMTVAQFLQQELSLTEEELDVYMNFNELKNFRSVNHGPLHKKWTMDHMEEGDIWRIGAFLFQLRKTVEDKWAVKCLNLLPTIG